MGNPFVIFLLDITKVINILQEIIKFLHEKMLKTTNLYSFHNNTSENNNSINDHSNESRINY